MITRLVGKSVYFFIKILFTEKVIERSADLSETDENLHICYRVIGIRPSAESLAKEISAHSNCVQVFGFNGFTQKIPSKIVDQDASMIIHGRKLSDGEIGCARSHQLAYLAPCHSEWTIFLEDDVSFHGDLSVIEKQLNQLALGPSVIFLDYGSQDFVCYPFWKKRHGTYSYALNKSALAIIRKSYSQIWCTADWPIQWAFQLQFLVLGQNTVKLNESEKSLIEGGRKEKKMSSVSVMQAEESTHSEIRQELYSLRSSSSMIKLFQFLRRNNVPRPLYTAFFASKSGLYSGGTE